MPDYNSAYTGVQIDSAVGKISSFAHTPAQIDASITKFDNITSTPAKIDDAVDYVEDLEDASIDASSISTALGFIGRFTNTPEDIDATVDKFETVNSQPSQIDDTVEKIVDNSASAGDILTANGTGGATWVTPSADKTFYHHTVLFTKTDDAETSRLSFEWIDTNPTSSSTRLLAEFYILSYYKNDVSAPKMALGVVFVEGTGVYINGIFYDTATSKYALVPDDYPTTSDLLKYSNFIGWTFSQRTVEIG